MKRKLDDTSSDEEPPSAKKSKIEPHATGLKRTSTSTGDRDGQYRKDDKKQPVDGKDSKDSKDSKGERQLSLENPLDMSLFLSSQEAENFQCAVCLSVVREPVNLACCHLFCRSCIASLQSDACPQCRAPIDRPSLTLNAYASKTASQLKMRCRHAECPAVFPRGTQPLPPHYDEKCTFELVPCPDCKKSMAKFELGQHRENQCTERKVQCSMCRQSFNVPEFKKHQTEQKDSPCPHYVRCRCSALIRDIFLAAHAPIQCNKAPVDCPHCNQQTTRSDWEAHISIASNEHYAAALSMPAAELKQIPFQRLQADDVKAWIHLCNKYQTCTRVLSGKQYIEQRYYRCLDCSPASASVGICEPCAAQCHAGHTLGRLIESPLFFCDCRDIGTCNCPGGSASSPRPPSPIEPLAP